MTAAPFPIVDNIFLQNLLPHRAPMVMIDCLYDFTEKTVAAGLTVQEDNIFVEDGILLEAGIIEHMAQSIALHTGYSFYIKQQTAPIGYLGTIKSISIDSFPQVGAKLLTKATILQEFMGVTLVSVESFVGDRQIAQAEIKSVIASS
ncbi:hypothetical protein [Sphingobacterium siyangense]|uniref:hypothetical protein n=1 Tax=Sphingobacterium siyangense TaxID=459529 RepID=UPI003C73C51A